jgi:hypothetical protein
VSIGVESDPGFQRFIASLHKMSRVMSAAVALGRAAKTEWPEVPKSEVTVGYRKTMPSASAEGVTRHPGAGAAGYRAWVAAGNR